MRRKRIKNMGLILEAEPSPYKAVALFHIDGSVVEDTDLDQHGRLMVDLDAKVLSVHVILHGYMNHNSDKKGGIGVKIFLERCVTKDRFYWKCGLRAVVGESSWLPSDYLTFWAESETDYKSTDGCILKTESGERIYIHLKLLGSFNMGDRPSGMFNMGDGPSRGQMRHLRLTVHNMDGGSAADRNPVAHKMLSSRTQRAHCEGVIR